jgi:hypothetical protein
VRGPVRRVTILILLAGVTALLMAGCAADTGQPEAEPVPLVSLDPPGIYQAGDGQVRAVGIFDRVELEGGFWAVLGVADTDSAESQVVAVIPNAEELDLDLASFRGRYVEVAGTLLDGASIRMAGPEIEASSVTIIAEEDPADALQPLQP